MTWTPPALRRRLRGRSPGQARDLPVPDGPEGRRRRLLILLICSSSLFMTYLDSTILNVALPTIQAQLHASVAGLQWVVDAYLLVLASLLLLSGSTADRIGRRRVFTTGLLAFSAGSLLCSIAPNLGALVAFRMLQALGGSMLTPVSLSILRHTFRDPGERARALGLWSGVFGLATACGPVAGGVLVDLVGWRSVFWVNVPVGIGALLLARRYVPESRARRPRRLDPAGQLLMIVLLATLTYAIISGPADGWSSALILSLLAVAVLAAAGFLVAERRRSEPLLELRFFRSPPFSGATAIAMLSFTVLAGFLFVNTLYLQEVHGDSPLIAGLATLPATLLIALSAPLAGRVVARRGPRLPLVAAGLLMAAGSAVLIGLRPDTSYGELAAAYALLGLGVGIVNPPITITAVTGMPPDQAGVASAVASTARQTGSVLGVAVMGAMLTAGFRAALPGRLAPLHLPPALHASLLRTGITAGSAASSTGSRHDPAAAAAAAAVGQAFTAATHGPWALAVACGVAVAAIALITTSARAQTRARAVASLPGRPAGPATAPPPQAPLPAGSHPARLHGHRRPR